MAVTNNFVGSPNYAVRRRGRFSNTPHGAQAQKHTTETGPQQGKQKFEVLECFMPQLMGEVPVCD